MGSHLWSFRDAVKVISVLIWYGNSSSFPRQHQRLLLLQPGCVGVLWLTQRAGTQTPVSSACVEAFLQQSHARLPVPALLMWSPFCNPSVSQTPPASLWWGLSSQLQQLEVNLCLYRPFTKGLEVGLLPLLFWLRRQWSSDSNRCHQLLMSHYMLPHLSECGFLGRGGEVWDGKCLQYAREVPAAATLDNWRHALHSGVLTSSWE